MSKEVVLITGATSGIGKCTAEYLHNKGYKVYGTGRNPINDCVNGVFLLPMDVRDVESINKVVHTIIEKEKKIDFLINNAGIGICAPIEQTPITTLYDVFSTNVFGSISTIQAVLPFMRERKKGTIINITSIAGYMGLPFRAGYCASKGALELFTESLRMEVKPFSVKVANIAPGDFATNIALRRHYASLNENSPYYKIYNKSLKLMNEHVNKGEHSIKMAKKIHSVMMSKNPKIHYKQARFLQKLSITLKCILPDRIFEKLLMNHYQL